MLRVVDLSSATEAGPEAGAASPPGVILAHGAAADLARCESWLQTATFTLTEDRCDDRRVVTVDSVPDALAELRIRCHHWPHASSVCDDVLRGVEPGGPALSAVVTESLAYSTLQAGPEFARWLQERGPARMPDIADPVRAQRDGDTLRHHIQPAATPQRVFHRCAGRAARSAGRRAAGPVGDRDRVERQRTIVLQRRAISRNSVPSPIRRARTWLAPGTAPPWRSMR